MTAAGHILNVDGVKRPHKAKHLLRTVFTPPPWFFELEQSRRRDPLDLLTKVNVVVWPERIRVLCSAREDVSCMMLDVYIENVKVLNE